MKRIKKILVIDDDLDIQKLVSVRLTSSGYSVITAADGKTGLEKARSEGPDLILLDVMLPDIDGYKVCTELKNDDDLKKIPIVMLTSLSQLGDIKSGIGSGANAYVAKPFRPEDLLETIKNIIG